MDTFRISAYQPEQPVRNTLFPWTKQGVYVLQLEEGKYYVGWTTDMLRRMGEHFLRIAAVWTQKYRPIKLLDYYPDADKEFERKKTLEMMVQHGWENVRGSIWCREKFTHGVPAEIEYAIRAAQAVTASSPPSPPSPPEHSCTHPQ